MYRSRQSAALLVLALSLWITAAHGGDQESVWAGVLEESAPGDQLLTLAANGQRFLALFNDDVSSETQGAVILLHGLGSHPDSPAVIHPLRTTLPDYGWATLAIQLPVLDPHASLQDYTPLLDPAVARLPAAIAFLKEREIHNLVIIGYDYGAVVASSYLSRNPASQINAFIGISMPGLRFADPRFFTPRQLEDITIPVLDIYGSRDYDHVTDNAALRARAARLSGRKVTLNQDLSAFKRSAIAQSAVTRRAGFIAFRQFVITAASHDYRGFEATLSKRIAGWLKRHASGVSIDRDRIKRLANAGSDIDM